MHRRLLEVPLVLCLLLVEAAEGVPQTNITTRTVTREVPRSLTLLGFGRLGEDANSNQEKDAHDGRLRVTLPSLPCSSDSQCLDYESVLVCSAGQCTCKPPSCWTYYIEMSGMWTSKYVFYCGQCGLLGSSCNETNLCDLPGECWSDGYCHCPRGENVDGVCLTTDTSWITKLSLAGVGIIALFIVGIMLFNCYKDPPWRSQEPWCCGLCPGAGGPKRRRRPSCEKSPAFTIQAHYASQEFTPPENVFENPGFHDNNGAVPRRPRRPSHVSSENSFSGAQSSVSSASTNVTSVSGSTNGTPSNPRSHPPLPPPPPPPSPPPPPPPSSPPREVALDSERGVRRKYKTEPVFTADMRIAPEVANLQAAEEASVNEDAESISSSGSCSHERCELCLPRGPATRPSPSSKGAAAGDAYRLPSLTLTPQSRPLAEDAVEVTML